MKHKKRRLTMNRRDFLTASVVTAGSAVALRRADGLVKKEEAKGLSSELAQLEEEDVRVFPNMATPNLCVIHDPNVCIGCNTCVEVCHQDVMIPNPEEGKPPVVVWPEECWSCGICVVNCSLGLEAKAITLNHPLSQRVRWKRKATGEHFRIGMSSPSPPNNKPPVGGWRAHSKYKGSKE